MSEKANRQAAQATFRQFAWNLAGTLAEKGRGAAKPKGAGSKR